MSSWLSALAEVRLEPLVFALLHTVWIGVIAAGVLVGVLRWLPGSRASLRYRAAMSAQLAIVLATLVTWVWLDRAAVLAPAVDPLLRAAAQVEESGTTAAGIGAEQHLAVTEFSESTAISGPMAISGPVDAAAANDSGKATTAASHAPPDEHWTRYLAGLWLAGVTLMLVRIALAVADAGRFVRSGRAAQSSTIELVDRLRGEMKIVRRVRVVSSRFCHCPAVAGVLWPTLVLPVSLLTELSPEAIRAILLHELAHIRRYDYLLNLMQMLIEAVLFFNPGVWWISRQIRIEREACCDALAVEITGEPIEYSRALADWAAWQRSDEQDRAPVAAMAIGGHRQPPLLSRLRRVLLPGERPGVHISPLSLLGFMLAALLTMGGLWQGTSIAVAVAAQILTAAERVEQVAEMVTANSSPRRSEGDSPVTLRGTVRTEDGQPLPEHIRASSYTRSENKSILSARGEFGETFGIGVLAGVIWLHLQADGYAPGVAGPFNGAPGEVIDDIEIVLPKGFPAEFVVSDEEGNPVAGAEVSAGFIFGSTSTDGLSAQSDQQGHGVFPHAIAGEYHVSIKASGFQDSGVVRMNIVRDETLPIKLRRALPVTGQVLTTAGAPIAGAEIQKFVTRGGPGVGNRIEGPIGAQLATTDDEGRFTLDQLVSGNTYDVLVKHPEHGTRVHEGIKPGQSDLRLTLGPNYTLEGTLRGDLSNLPQRRGKLYVKVRQDVPVGPEGVRGWYGDEGLVEPTDTGGRFTISGLLPAKTTAIVGQHKVMLDITEPHQQVAIDLTKPVPTHETRQVELVLEADENAPPRGSIEILATRPSAGVAPERKTVSLHEGLARFEMAVGAEIRVWPNGLIGYWFESQSLSVEAGEGPQRVRIETVAAGAISGLILQPDGSPAADASVTIRAVEKPDELKMQSITPSTGQQMDARGRFVITPLPLGVTYVMTAEKGHNKAVSELVELTAAAPTAEVKLELAPEASAVGIVLGPDGEPLADVPLQLEFKHPHTSTTWGTSFPTDRSGRFQVDGLSSTVGVYQVRLATNKGYQPQTTRLNPGGPAVTMQLKAGHVLKGRVVDAATGKPIPGVDLYAYPTEHQPGETFGFEAEGETALDGSFRFSNLSQQPYQINDRNGLHWDKDTAKNLLPDQEKELIIKATLPAWSRLKVAD